MGVIRRPAQNTRHYHRGVHTREIFMGIYRTDDPALGYKLLKSTWLLAPDAGMNMTRTQWGESKQLLNGMAASVSSVYGGRKLSMSWSLCDEEHISWLEDIVTMCAARETYVVFHHPAGGNQASPLFATPALHEQVYSPYAWDSAGARRGVAQEDGSLILSATANNIVEYTEPLIVPPGYNITFQVNRLSQGATVKPEIWMMRADNRWGFFTMDSAKWVYGSSGEARLLYLKYGGGRSGHGQLFPCYIQIVADQQAVPGWGGQFEIKRPKGTTRLKPVPGSLSIEMNAHKLDWYTASLDFEEVTPWR